MSMMQRIEALQKRHASIDLTLHEEEVRPLPDRVRVHQLKRTKLFLKDEIARLRHLSTAAVAEARAAE